MNATERAALLQGFELYDEVASTVNGRTLEILDHRRRKSTVRRRGWLMRRMLLAADLLGLIVAFLLAEWVVNSRNNLGTFSARDEVIGFIATLPLWVVVAKLYGLYDHDEERTNHSTADDFGGVFHMVTVCTWTFAVSAYLTHFAHPTAVKLVVFWAAAVSLVSIGRASARAAVHRSVTYLQNTVIVGAGEVGQLIAKKLLQHPEYGINLVGFVDSEPKERRDDLEHLALLGGIDCLPGAVRILDVERVIVAFSNDGRKEILDLVRLLNELNVQVDIVPRYFDVLSPGVDLHSVEGLPLLGLRAPRLSRSSKLLKRSLDLAITGALLVLLAPILALLAIAIRIDSAGPVLFRQVRMGARGRTFTIYKFRTMCADADARKSEVAHLNRHARGGSDARMFKVVGDPRVTRLGRILRRLSIDELPQLWNVLRGEMSLVGPRPLILEEDAHVTDWAERRLDLKPGITGIWQVLGRDGIPFEEMVRLDYVYVTSWSLGGDLRLLLRTLPSMVRGT
jgi:exopolysaccharide biosynthesis polyprenyl glycosylphosphotransferase